MYKIAICDDENIMLEYMYERILCLLDKRIQLYEIRKFSSGEALLKTINNGSRYDAVFLDIEMDKISGLDVAESITSISEAIHIVFVTNRDNLIFEAINYRPFSFIRKSRLNEELEKVINRLIEKREKKQQFYEFEIDRKLIKINPKDILYFESQGHYVFIRCLDNDYKIRGKLFDYEARMNRFGFIRIHIAYLVNIRHVCFVKYDGVSLDNGIILPISRKKIEITKNKHLEYVRESVHGNN